MSKINVVDARPLFTKMVVDVYREVTTPTEFLRSFFPTVEAPTKEISIEVQRGTEKVAADVFRGSQGRRNNMALSTEKIIIPPYYREYFDATQLTFYDRMFGEAGGEVSEQTFAGWIATVVQKLVPLQQKIERAYELQCSQVLQTGVVELKSATNIDFKRKAASIVDIGGPDYWTQAGADPLEDIENGCNFIRKEGKAMGGEFNMILGSAALRALLNNDVFKEQGDLRRVELVSINMAQRNAVGSTFHGTISAGSYIVRVWSYPQFYDNDAGVSTPYIDDENMIILPEVPRFKLSFAGVPRIFRDPRNAEFPEFIQNTQGAFVVGNYLDETAESHIFDVKSAGIAWPIGIDQIYTAKVV